MPTRRTEQTTPDLFSPPTATKEPEPQVVLQGEIEPANPGSTPRHLLPKDLAGALKRLDDAEIDSLFSAVTEEAKRRSRLPEFAMRTRRPYARLSTSC